MKKIITLTTVAIFGIFSLFGIAADKRKAHKFFDGEFTVKPKGIYTYVHYYRHPETKREVALVGMCHIGEREYFEKIAKILGEYEIVLYEDSPYPYRLTLKEFREKEKELDEISGEVDELFDLAMSYARAASVNYFNLVDERYLFNLPRLNHWQSAASGYTEFLLRLQETGESDRYLKDFCKKWKLLTPEKRQDLVNFIASSLEKIRKQQFTKDDFKESIIYLQADALLNDIINDLYFVQWRDKLALKNFDRIVREKNPRKIAIKFGATHIRHLRELLERRGYLFQRTIELRGISF